MRAAVGMTVAAYQEVNHFYGSPRLASRKQHI
jgi:hypothetical protein